MLTRFSWNIKLFSAGDVVLNCFVPAMEELAIRIFYAVAQRPADTGNILDRPCLRQAAPPERRLPWCRHRCQEKHRAFGRIVADYFTTFGFVVVLCFGRTRCVVGVGHSVTSVHGRHQGQRTLDVDTCFFHLFARDTVGVK